MITLDDEQKKIITLGAEALVLAPPGCGKTHVLTERVRAAHAEGVVGGGDMLCLTFTNRAARNMRERLRETINENQMAQMYVGNIHRFCARFLFENALVSASVSIIDDDEALSIVAHAMGQDTAEVIKNKYSSNECISAIHFSTMMRQIELGHPREVRLHPECLTSSDLEELKNICLTEHSSFTPSAMIKTYHHASDYREKTKHPQPKPEGQTALLRKMELALAYDNYKAEHNLADFNDILILTYDALAREKDEWEKSGRKNEQRLYKHYSWCEIDEVQDLTPLQLRIADLLMTPEEHTMVFFGDFQQAIFSFMGAKMDTLLQLEKRCSGHIYHLEKNHRSPKYILDVINTYAREELGCRSNLLPTASSEEVPMGNELSIICSPTLKNEYYDVAQQAQRLSLSYPNETTAVIVLTNNDAEKLSRSMNQLGVKHFKVSGTDIFATPQVKLLIAHLSVYANEHNFLAWMRLLNGLHVCQTDASARNFLSSLFDRALTPLDLMMRPGSSYIMEFAKTYEEKEIVVFDTETTGLNVYEDDIVQIAAVKLRCGKIVPDSAFSVYIESNREIPKMLGDTVNPIIEERRCHELLSHEEGLSLFMDYIGDDILLGHNADYDYSILRENLRRYLPSCDLRSQTLIYFDSLRLVRSLFPHLSQYKLKSLLQTFHLEGENSHLADADVAATVSVVRHCYTTSKEIVSTQKDFLSREEVREKAALMQTKMRPIYLATQSRLHTMQGKESKALIADEMERFYKYLVKQEIIDPVLNIEYVFRYISQEIIDRTTASSLLSQISRYVPELSTLTGSDLLGNGIVDENVWITTIHKAKGLEFDNVIVFDAADDRYPSVLSQNNPRSIEEDKRKFYVALSRAKRRIVISFSETKQNYHGRYVSRSITPFFHSIYSFFTPHEKLSRPFIFNSSEITSHD